MNIKQGSLENIILNALWHVEENCENEVNVSDIQAKININSKKWAYTTIKTVLDRLVDKDLVLRIKQGNKYYYRSKISRLSAGETAIKRVIRQYYNNDVEALIKAVEKVQNETLLVTK